MDEVSHNPDPIIEQLTIINGVVRRPVVTGDGFHIGNLAIMHASMGFADNTENAEHEQIHHRQVLMSLHSLHSDDPGYAQSIMDQAMTDKKRVVLQTWKERQQRWLVNQRFARQAVTMLRYCTGSGLLHKLRD